MRRAVMISGSYPTMTCGIADYTHALSSALRDLGLPVVNWTRSRSEVTPSEFLQTVTSSYDNAGLQTLFDALVAERPSVVHLQYETSIYDRNPNVAGVVRAAKRAGAPLVTTFHALDGPPQWKKAHRLALLPLLLGSQDITVCSERQYNALKRLPFVRDKVRLIPVGSSVPVTASLPNRSVARLEGGPLRLLYFGFVWRGRNLETAICALAETVKAVPEGATLTIVGGIRDEGYRREMEALAEQYGVRPYVRFTDDLPASEISQHLADADIALLPFPTGVSTGRTTFIAALEHGLPVVTMSVPDNLTPQFVQDENMLMVPVGDEAGFVRETVRLARDFALRTRLSQGALSLGQQFSWPAVAREIAGLSGYRGVAGAPALTPVPSPNSGRGESPFSTGVSEPVSPFDNSDSPLPELGEGTGVRAGQGKK